MSEEFKIGDKVIYKNQVMTITELLADGGVACEWLGQNGKPNSRVYDPPVHLKKYVRTRRHAAGLI